MTVYVKYLHPLANASHVGFIPDMLDVNNPKPAKEQLHEGYRHGGGWNPMTRFELRNDNSLKYPGDPPLKPVAEMKLRDETIFVYEHDIVVIVQPDRSFEAARMD